MSCFFLITNYYYYAAVLGISLFKLITVGYVLLQMNGSCLGRERREALLLACVVFYLFGPSLFCQEEENVFDGLFIDRQNKRKVKEDPF